MSRVRALMKRHWLLAMMIVVAALCVRAFIPQGMMIGGGSTLLTVQICSDAGQTGMVQIAIPRHGSSGDQGGPSSSDHAPCAFSSLAMGALGGADAPMLASALAIILLLGFAPVAPVLRQRPAYLRPPLRGPPAHA